MQHSRGWFGIGRTTATALAAVALLVLLIAAPALAHPLSRGALDVVAYPDRVAVQARVTVEEVIVTEMMTAENIADVAGRRNTDEMYARHAKYLAAHIRVFADGAQLTPRVGDVAQPTTQPSQADTLGADGEHASYRFEFPLPAGAAAPKTLKLEHDVLVGLSLGPGITWEASYVVNIGPAGGRRTEGLLLTHTMPVVEELDWTPAGGGGGAGTQPAVASTDKWRLAKDYAAHGVHHILSGYDHLLFISALVLAAVSLWDLVKVVTAFTLAHTMTLALAALQLVSLPEWIVEPMIAASIVFVAMQNVLWPKQARGWGRLAVAFGFGLFHGLGFAGGLLDAMQEMSGTTIVLAIAAFSVGVEVGHQLIVLPLFGVLKLARRTKEELADRDRVSLAALRYGSAVICVAGLYYLVGAVISAVAVSGHS